ncbi:MAG: IcmT/TraK family protein [Rhodobacteraceae bacterium]|nr:IcmT/TraK family protein [Paracoccaceae bacterium]
MKSETNHWRATQTPTRFFLLDSRVTIFVALCLLHFAAWTFILLIVAVFLSIWLTLRGIRPGTEWRHIWRLMVGRKFTARGRRHQRLPVDFGFETEPALGRPGKRRWIS